MQKCAYSHSAGNGVGYTKYGDDISINVGSSGHFPTDNHAAA